jgi:pimeloyl-ACP methyl ester carboxylesterase
METFTRDGLTFDVQDDGPSGAEAVILLHGFPENRTCWDQVVPRLVQAGYRTLAPDQRGYSPGARPERLSAYRPQALAADVLALADQAGVGRFHIVGHDWGGAVAWTLGAWHPDRLLTLTSLATPHPRAFIRASLTSDQAARSQYMAFFQLRGVAERTLLQAGGARFAKSLGKSGLDRERARGYVAFLSDPGAMTGALNWYRAMRPIDARLGPAMAPTLYVWATEDVALGRKAAELTARYVAGPYRFEVLGGVSHWIPEEVPELVARLLLEHVTHSLP